MYRNEFDNILRQRPDVSAVMLYGESHFLIDYYIKKLQSAMSEGTNVLNLYHDEYNFNSAKAHLSQGSLFSDKNLLLIKSEKKVPKKELDTLLELVQKNPDNSFIYAYYGPDMKGSSKAFNKKSGGLEVRMFHPYGPEAKTMLLQEAQALNVQLDPYSANHLLESQNGDLELAFNELNKLQILQRAITTKDIDALVYGVGEVKLDTFIDHLLEKKDFKKELLQILERGEDEIRVITTLSGQITQLYLFYTQIKLNGISDSRAILGFKLPPKIEKERAQQSIRLKQHQYDAILDLLLEYELKMKSKGGMDKNALLISALIRLQSLL